MEPWVIGMICNGIIAVAYLLISLAITVPLARSGQLRSNPLGAVAESDDSVHLGQLPDRRLVRSRSALDRRRRHH